LQLTVGICGFIEGFVVCGGFWFVGRFLANPCRASGQLNFVARKEIEGI